jgi:hypothetical protein
MGPCLSLLPVGKPAPEGPYEMQSEESRKWLDSKAPLGETGGCSGDPEPYSKQRPKHFTGQSNTKIISKFALGASVPSLIKYNVGELSVKTMQNLDGADVDVVDGVLHVFAGFATGVEAPCGVWSSAKDAFVIMPRVMMVDLYLSVDGKPYTDGHVCLGEPSFNKDKAIKEIDNTNVIMVYKHVEKPLENALRKGPSDGSKPWATVVSDKFADCAFVHLPLMYQGDLDKMNTAESEAYGHSLVAKFSQALKTAGEGTHSFTLSVRPRGIVDVSQLDEGEQVFQTVGLINKSPEDVAARDKGFEPHLSQFPPQVLTDANASGLTVTFTMGVGSDAASGAAPSRKAAEFSTQWPSDELEECVELARSLAGKGPCGRKASQMGVGKLAHIVLVGRGIEQKLAGSKEWDEFQCYALFKAKNGSPDALGAQIFFRPRKLKVKENGIPVPDPEWESSAFGMHSDTIEIAQPIANKEIDAAIQRDAKYYDWD